MTKTSTTSGSSKRAHIISRDDGWAIKIEGNIKATKIYQKKDSAIKGARKLVEQGHDVIVHKKDGSIQNWEKGKKDK
ncbi:MAG: DUF2188 domain-containing protein [Desulfobaccales bacterium]|jgi:hypothetical protein